VFEAQKRGFRSVMDVADLGVWYLGAGITANKRVLNERPELADRYLRALAQATSRVLTDREFAIDIIGRYNQMSDRELLGATVDYYRPRFLLDPYPDPKAVQAVLDNEEDPRARALRPEEVTDYRFAERLRASGFLEQLPK
jgi:ABC-type nitrate/sulfonate/bicarbonate transport system substrate-binding protein